MKRLSAALFGILLCLLALGAAWAADPPVPQLKTRVTDLVGMLPVAERDALEQKLAALEARKGSQLAVLIVATTQPETVEQYAIRVAEAWRLGRKGVDDGLLLLVARDDRALRIEVGYGLEGAIPDVTAKRVIEEIIVPRFKAGDLPGGVRDGVDRLIGLVDGEPLPAPPSRDTGLNGASIEGFLPFLMLFVFVIGGVLRAIFGRLFGASLAGGVAFLGGWLVMSSLLAGLVAAFIVFLMVLSGGGGGISRGGGGFGGGHGGGGGGFSGGGGGFGGGGASGRW